VRLTGEILLDLSFVKKGLFEAQMRVKAQEIDLSKKNVETLIAELVLVMPHLMVRVGGLEKYMVGKAFQCWTCPS
jgi:hypothetical protein